MCHPAFPDTYQYISAKLDDWRHPAVESGSGSSHRVYQKMYDSLGVLKMPVEKLVSVHKNRSCDISADDIQSNPLLLEFKNAGVDHITISDKDGCFRLEVSWIDKNILWTIYDGDRD